MITVVGYIDMLKPKSTIHRLLRTSTPLTDNTLLMGTNGEETNAISLEEVKQYLGGGAENAIPLSEKGQPNGVPTLGPNGKIPSSQLPAISGGGGINVIEYDPSLHEAFTHTIGNSDLIPTPASGVNTTASASWNTATGVMGIANPSGVIPSYGVSNTQHVGLKLPLSIVGMQGSFTINASQCQDAWGIGLLSESADILALTNGIENLDLSIYIEAQHYKDQPYTSLNISTPQTLGMFSTAEVNKYVPRLWVTDPFSGEYQRQTNSAVEGKPQGVYTFTIGDIIDVYVAFTGLTAEQTLNLFQSNLPENSLNLMLSKTFLYCLELEALFEIKTDTPFLHFFMTAYHLETDPTGTYELDPTSELTLTLNLQQLANTVPAEAVDGDFLHLLDNANLLNKSLAKGSFVQLYDNTSKMIVHANQP